MVLVPIALIVLIMALVLQYTTTVRRRRAQVGGLITFLLIYASTNVGPIAAAIRVGNDYQRAAPGDEALRLIPFLQLDTRLILTSWTLDQLLIGFTAVLPVLIIFQQRLRTTFWIVFAAVVVGVEINEGWANMSGITPPFRIDIHDVALRALGALADILGTLDPQRLDGFVEIAVGLGKCVLAVHHSRAGELAEPLDVGGGVVSHLSLP